MLLDEPFISDYFLCQELVIEYAWSRIILDPMLLFSLDTNQNLFCALKSVLEISFNISEIAM